MSTSWPFTASVRKLELYVAENFTKFLFCNKLCVVFEEPEDPNSRSFFSEIISSISDVKFSHNGRYMITRDYLSVKVWDLNMENRPVETFQVGYFFDNIYLTEKFIWVLVTQTPTLIDSNPNPGFCLKPYLNLEILSKDV